MTPRKAWLAALLSLFVPGLGQLYNGDYVWPVAAMVIGSVLALVSSIYFFDSLSLLLWAILFGLVFDTFFAAHAWRQAKLGGKSRAFHATWWKAGGVYILFTLVLYGLPNGYGLFYPERFLSFQIPSESMVPTLLVGDRLVADGWAYRNEGPRTGDIIVFDYPKDHSVKYVKRVVGVPGDEVEMIAGQLYINGKLVKVIRSEEPVPSDGGRPMVDFTEFLGDAKHTVRKSEPPFMVSFPLTKVPEDSYFAMGDNRDRSSDSRVWGFVKREEIVGRMAYVYFSWDTNAPTWSSAIRKDRFGLRVQ